MDISVLPMAARRDLERSSAVDSGHWNEPPSRDQSPLEPGPPGPPGPEVLQTAILPDLAALAALDQSWQDFV